MPCEATKRALRFVICDLDEGEAGFCCPVCGCDSVHPAGFVVEQGKTRTVVTCETTSVEATERGKHSRGSLVLLSFWCKEGHLFHYRFEFHNGQTFCELHAGQHDGSDELWRD